MHVFVINLDRNVERLDFVGKQLDRLGIQYERFPGIDGRKMSNEERKRLSSPFRSRLIQAYPIMGGVLGCALSHLAVYREIINRKFPFALIFEDDVIVSEGFRELSEWVAEQLDEERPQVALFSNWGGQMSLSQRAMVREKGGSCADAYLITRKAAKLILRVNSPVIYVADAWGRWVRRHGLELFRVYPTLVKQNIDTFQSDIRDSSIDPREQLGKNGTGREGVDLILFRCRRVVEKILDYTLYLFLGK